MAEYDVAIVGASVSGCITARLLAERGARVLIADRVTAGDTYKVACTHFIQAGALPAIERIGLKPLLEQAGAVPTTIDAWTPWGWIQPRPASPTVVPRHGYNIRRQTLDPLVRALAADTPGVDLELGWKAEQLGGRRGAPDTLCLSHRNGQTRWVRTRLIVGADGRDSTVAQLAGVPSWRARNNRIAYFAHYADLPLDGASCRMWFLNPDGAAAFATDGGITVLSAMLARERADMLALDLEDRFDQFFGRLPWAPAMQRATRVSKVMGRREMTTVTRPPAWGGIALVGDAATAADPLQGVGLGWAIESAEMLAHSACEYLGDCASLRAALRRYARRHTIRFGAHQAMSNYVARALPYLPLERGVLRAAANDPQIALEVYRFSSRDIQPYRLLRPGTLARIARVNVGLSRDPAARRPDPHAYVPGVRTPATARASEPELAHA